MKEYMIYGYVFKIWISDIMYARILLAGLTVCKWQGFTMVPSFDNDPFIMTQFIEFLKLARVGRRGTVNARYTTTRSATGKSSNIPPSKSFTKKLAKSTLIHSRV